MTGNILELIEMMRNPGESGVPDTVYDDLTSLVTSETASYEEQLASALARNAELEGQVQGLNGEVSRLRNAVYEQTLEAPGNGGSGADENDDPADSDDDEPYGIDALFTTKETK